MDSYERALQAENDQLRQQVLERDMLLRLVLQAVGGQVTIPHAGREPFRGRLVAQRDEGGRADLLRLVD